MSRMDAFFYLEDVAKFRRTLDKVEAVPQKVVTKAAGRVAQWCGRPSVDRSRWTPAP